MCQLTCINALILVFVGCVATIGFGFFILLVRDDAENIMANNRLAEDAAHKDWFKDTGDMDENGLEVNEEERPDTEYWEKFIKDNHFTPIGEVYDKCDEHDRMMVGRVIMLPNNALLSRVKARAFINMTLDSEVTDGAFHLEVQLNGNTILNRQWELCTLDEDADDRVIFCPMLPKDYSVVKDKAIPSLLPRVKIEAWMENHIAGMYTKWHVCQGYVGVNLEASDKVANVKRNLGYPP